MFANIRNAIASMIATKHATNTICHQPDNLKIAQFQPHDRTTSVKPSTQAKKVNFEGITGSLPVELVKGLSSDGLRKQLIGKMVYSYVAKGFNEFVKNQKRGDVTDAASFAINMAAEACAQSNMMGFPVDYDEERWSFLVLSGVPNKLSEAHAKLVADITGQSTEELMKNREAKRKAKFLSNQDALTTYLTLVQAAQPMLQMNAESDWERIEVDHQDFNLKLSGAATMSALASYMEFVTGWNNEIKMAAELLLIRDDQKLSEAALSRADRQERADAPDYVKQSDDRLLSAHGMAAGMASGK